MESYDCSSCKIQLVKLDGEVKLIHEKHNTLQRDHNEISDTLKTLNKSVNELVKAIATSEGKKEGIDENKRNNRMLYGGLITALVIAFISTTISLNNKVSVMTEQIAILNKKVDSKK